MKTIIASAVCSIVLVTAAAAQTGPVATKCKDDIAKFCASETHDGGIRACLETNKDKVSASCKRALETTGGGMGKKKKN
jgi:hypothetical protein